MHALLIPVGSAGDVHPFVGIGRALRDRGHRVTVITNAYFQDLIEREGLEFVSLGTAEEYVDLTNNPDLWHRRKGFQVVVEASLRILSEVYEAIRERYVPGETVVAATGLAFGARIAQEKLGVPTATVLLQPICLRSLDETSVYSGLFLPQWTPRLVKRGMFHLVDLVADSAVAAGVNAFRAELGLPPVRRIFFDWWNSPNRVIGLFPDWYAAPQPDWPPNTVLTGFPLYDERGVSDVPDEVSAFLDAGDPPIVFTPGSAMQQGRAFFEASRQACELLGRRGVLLTRFGDQVPEHLPETLRHFDYVPFSALLPHAAALVHHGGIGTLSQGLAAGVPQLIMPMSHDQPDNANRVERLGVGRSIKPSTYRGPKVARKLTELLQSPDVHARCRELASRLQQARPLDAVCAYLEELGTTAPSEVVGH